MRNYCYLLFTVCGLWSTSLCAQLDSLQQLPEVILSDIKVRDFSQGIAVQKIEDSILRHNPTRATELLGVESLIYFRENGPGGVSSASYRGTNAQQTAVVWNGININSQLTGQTDFNTVAVKNYDAISFRKGGGSIPYGSGAVAGSVHLNNDISFGERFDTEINLGYGSFNTPTGNIKSTYASERLYVNVAGDYVNSDNDFAILDTELFNENGAFQTTNINLNVGYKLASNHVLKLYHNSFFGTRNFSGTLTAPSDDAFQDRNARTLIEWQYQATKWTSKLRFAQVFEEFEFFPSGLEEDISTTGRANRFTTNYDIGYNFSKNASLKAIVDYTTIVGNGTNLQRSRRNIGSAVLLWNHKPTAKLEYGLQLRQELTDDYESPLLFGLGASYAFAKAYTFKINASQNYRIPTFNDVFWQGAGAAGNPDLLPERTLQVDVGHDFAYKNLKLGVNTYYIQGQDLIVWLPNFQGIWMPINLRETENYGLETTLDYGFSWDENTVGLRAGYAYTEAINREDETTLIYVPQHKVTASAAFRHKRWNASYQFFYNDEVFITTDNNQTLAGYGVSNVSLRYDLLKGATQQMNVSLRANNIFNKNYQTVAFRPNPGRNFLIQTTYTF